MHTSLWTFSFSRRSFTISVTAAILKKIKSPQVQFIKTLEPCWSQFSYVSLKVRVKCRASASLSWNTNSLRPRILWRSQGRVVMGGLGTGLLLRLRLRSVNKFQLSSSHWEIFSFIAILILSKFYSRVSFSVRWHMGWGMFNWWDVYVHKIR